MALHSGQTYGDEDTSLGMAVPATILGAAISDDVVQDARDAVSWAQEDENVYYFSVYAGCVLVGGIYLHDIDRRSGEAMIGYHLFQPRYRGRGIGTRALRLLQQYVRAETALRRLVIITERNNQASRQMAARCGFEYVGGAREDPDHLVVLEWHACGGDGGPSD